MKKIYIFTIYKVSFRGNKKKTVKTRKKSVMKIKERRIFNLIYTFFYIFGNCTQALFSFYGTLTVKNRDGSPI